MTITISDVVIKGLEEIEVPPVKKGEKPGVKIQAIVDVTLHIAIGDLLVFNKRKGMK